MRGLLDADVLIGALDGSDPYHGRTRRLMTGWRERRDAISISVVNLTEVLIAPSSDARRLAVAREAIAALGIMVHLPSQAIGIEAARLRGRYQVSLPDAYCLATAKQTGSTLISFDHKVLRAAVDEGLSTA